MSEIKRFDPWWNDEEMVDAASGECEGFRGRKKQARSDYRRASDMTLDEQRTEDS